MNPLDTHEPMGLVVHSLPDACAPQASLAVARGRWELLLLLLVCSMPVLVSYFVYFVLRPEGKTSLGEWIAPPRAVGRQMGTDRLGKQLPLAALKGQWLLVVVSTQACAQDCERRLYLMRQLRATLGKDMDRVDAVWLVAEGESATDIPAKSVQAATTVLRVEPQALASWLEVPPGRALSDYLFVVDPLGNAMLRLPGRLDVPDAAKARRDLERLLRASVSWDGAGRGAQ